MISTIHHEFTKVRSLTLCYILLCIYLYTHLHTKKWTVHIVINGGYFQGRVGMGKRISLYFILITSLYFKLCTVREYPCIAFVIKNKIFCIQQRDHKKKQNSFTTSFMSVLAYFSSRLHSTKYTTLATCKIIIQMFQIQLCSSGLMFLNCTTKENTDNNKKIYKSSKITNNNNPKCLRAYSKV